MTNKELPNSVGMGHPWNLTTAQLVLIAHFKRTRVKHVHKPVAQGSEWHNCQIEDD